jgi:hypothetical protein
MFLTPSMNLSLLRVRWEETDWLSPSCPALGSPWWETDRGCGPEGDESGALVMILGVLVAVAPTAAWAVRLSRCTDLYGEIFMQHVLNTLKEAEVCRIGKNGGKDGICSRRCLYACTGEVVSIKYCIRGEMSVRSFGRSLTLCACREKR